LVCLFFFSVNYCFLLLVMLQEMVKSLQRILELMLMIQQAHFLLKL
jgi:hypothetical protein